MAVLGTGRFVYGVGWTDAEVECFDYLQKLAAKVRESERRTYTPTTRMRNCLSRYCRKAVVDGRVVSDDTYIWNDSVVFELEKAFWSDVGTSRDWLWYLRKVYVLDSKRGNGLGKGFVNELKLWCDQSDCVVSLFADGFGFCKNELDCGAFYFDDINELLRVWSSGTHARNQPQFGIEHLYERCGFTRACIIDDGFFNFSPEKYTIEKQFVYIGRYAASRIVPEIRHRLDAVFLCDFCKSKD